MIRIVVKFALFLLAQEGVNLTFFFGESVSYFNSEASYPACFALGAAFVAILWILFLDSSFSKVKTLPVYLSLLSFRSFNQEIIISLCGQLIVLKV